MRHSGYNDGLNDFNADKMLSQCGTYILVGEKDGVPAAYIGQANARKNGKGVLGRAIEHRKPAEDYWTEAFMVVSKTNTIGATELNYLENQLCNMALEAGRYMIVNAVDPSTGHYSDMVESVMNVFISGQLKILQIMGYKIFVPMKKRASSNRASSKRV